MPKKPTYEDLEKSIRKLEEDSDKLKLAEEALRESEERFRLLAETSPDYIYQVDTEGTILYASSAVENILGFKSQELIGTNFMNLVPVDARSDTMKKFQTVLSQNGTDAYEVLVTKKMGRMYI